MPGLPSIAELTFPGRRRIGPFELVYDDTPPSLNAVGSRGASAGAHWSFTHAKREWQGAIEQLLMAARVPRGRCDVALAGARMRFPKPNTRRDSGNFSTMLEKALGDALVSYRAIPDDTAEQFWLSGVEFEREAGHNRTTIVLWLIEKEDEQNGK